MSLAPVQQIGLHEPLLDADDECLVLEAIRSSWVSTGGPFVARFEQEFCQYTGAKHAVSVANGTVGLSLMIDTLARTKGVAGPFDVLVPDLTFIATANAVVHAGGHPVFVDASPGSVNVSVAGIIAAINEGYQFQKATGSWASVTSGRPLLAIVPVHLLGWGCDMGALKAFCGETRIPILEDAAEAVGVFWDSGTKSHLGLDGLAATFSFNGNKILTTGGGGMVITSDDVFAARLRHLSTTAKTDGLRFAHDEVGFNYRMTNLAAALGCSQLRKLPARLERKSRLAQVYQTALRNVPGVKVHSELGVKSNHWLVNVVFDRFEDRERALKHLIDQGAQARPLWTPNHLQAAYRNYPQLQTSFPEAMATWQRTLSLPSSPQLSDETICWIASIISASITTT